MENQENYRYCKVIFKDDNSSCEVLFKLSTDYLEEEDDEIFFFCNGLSELERLMNKDNGEDFYIKEILGY